MDNTAETHKRIPPQACWTSTVLCTSTNHVFNHSAPAYTSLENACRGECESRFPVQLCKHTAHWQFPSCKSYEYDINMEALGLHTLVIFSPTAINQKSWQKQPCMLLLPVMTLLWEAGFHIRKHADHKDAISPTSSGVESIGYGGGEGAAAGGTDEMGNRKAQKAMTSVSQSSKDNLHATITDS